MADKISTPVVLKIKIEYQKAAFHPVQNISVWSFMGTSVSDSDLSASASNSHQPTTSVNPFCPNTLYQEFTNYALPGFVSKVLLENSRAHLFTYLMAVLSRR